MAGSAVDWQAREYETVEQEDPAPDVPANDELSIALSPEPPILESMVPEPVLTAEQREIKELRDQLARVSGRKDVLPVVDPLASPGSQDNILIHFLQDGMTALGKVWYRGEELEFEVGSQAYKDTFDRRGWSWLELRHDEFAQVDRWGQIMFRPGPWPGKTYADGTFETLKDVSGSGSVKAPSVQELAAAEKARKRRAAPRLPSLTQS